MSELMQESPLETIAEENPFSDEVFQTHVNVLLDAFANDLDDSKRDRALAEVHAYMVMFDKGFRMMFVQMNQAGPMAFLKMMLGKRG